MKCPYREDHMCVFEVDGVVNHNVSSKILHQNLSAEGWKGVFLSLLDFLAAQIRTFLTNFRFWPLEIDLRIEHGLA